MAEGCTNGGDWGDGLDNDGISKKEGGGRKEKGKKMHDRGPKRLFFQEATGGKWMERGGGGFRFQVVGWTYWGAGREGEG